MALEDAYFISQIVAVFLLLASLVFVGIQIRQNTKAIRAASAFDVNRMWGEFNLNSSLGTEEAAFQMKLLNPSNEISDFSPLEIAKARVIVMGLSQLWHSQFRLFQEGSLMREDWEPHGKYAAHFYRMPLVQMFGEEARASGHYLPEFEAEIARLDTMLDKDASFFLDRFTRAGSSPSD